MTPGYCGFFTEPDWVDNTEQQEYCEVVATDDGMCFIDTERSFWRSWIESDLTVTLGDVR